VPAGLFTPGSTLCHDPGIMTHPGLPPGWGILVWVGMGLLTAWAVWAPPPTGVREHSLPLGRLPLIGGLLHRLSTAPWLLRSLKLTLVALFLLVIIAGLFGTPIPERNLATVLTWNLWWAGLVVAIFFLGSAWCAVCPWDSLAQWLVRRRLWRRGAPHTSLGLRVPKRLRNVAPALLLFVGLTWLELGLGVTASPYTTALLALVMVVLATVSRALFERKAFCRYFCPVGRTVGFYAQISPLELRPIDAATCARCTHLACYHGSAEIEPCPTHLVMGRLTQNTYCTSCGNCVQSCPSGNVGWRLRPTSREALQDARPHWDEAGFMLSLLALTGFHGVTMMPFWQTEMSRLAQWIGDGGRLLTSFSLGLLVALAIPLLVYLLLSALTHRLLRGTVPFKPLLSGLAFVALPLAFAYHLAHNLNHLVRETGDLGALLANPLGLGTHPLSRAEHHARSLDLLLSTDTLFLLQAGLILFGFWTAMQVLRHRGPRLVPNGPPLTGGRLLPMLAFALGMSGFHLWLLMQPMIMRL